MRDRPRAGRRGGAREDRGAPARRRADRHPHAAVAGIEVARRGATTRRTRPSSSTPRTATARCSPRRSTRAPAASCSRRRRSPTSAARWSSSPGRTYVDPVLAGFLRRVRRRTSCRPHPARARRPAPALGRPLDEEIGKRLFISPETVRTHVRKAMGKLDADTRTQAVATALRQSRHRVGGGGVRGGREASKTGLATDVVSLVRAPRLGRGGREFESRRPDGARSVRRGGGLGPASLTAAGSDGIVMVAA